jgi:hypothetical protein
VIDNFFDRPLNERRAEFEIRLVQALASRKAKEKWATQTPKVSRLQRYSDDFALIEMVRAERVFPASRKQTVWSN